MRVCTTDEKRGAAGAEVRKGKEREGADESPEKKKNREEGPRTCKYADKLPAKRRCDLRASSERRKIIGTRSVRGGAKERQSALPHSAETKGAMNRGEGSQNIEMVKQHSGWTGARMARQIRGRQLSASGTYKKG